MCTLAPARAQEVRIGLEQQLNAESNVFKTAEDEQVVSVERLSEDEEAASDGAGSPPGD